MDVAENPTTITCMLQAVGLEKSYPTRSGRLDILRKVELAVAPGETVVIMGPSGSGKSTLLNILGTLESPTGGQLTLGDVRPFELPEADLARFRNSQIGFVFQDHHLLPQCTLLENVLLPTLARKGDRGARGRAAEWLARVGLADRLDHRPAELSGGERQRGAIARALINDPVLVLADEPTGNLDRSSADTVADVLSAIQSDGQRMLVVVTHSDRLADRFDKHYELDGGTLRPR